MINESQKYPDNKKAYDENYDRIFASMPEVPEHCKCPGKSQCAKSCEGCRKNPGEFIEVKIPVSNRYRADHPELPDSREDCDLGEINGEPCALNKIQGCVDCVIGRKKNVPEQD